LIRRADPATRRAKAKKDIHQEVVCVLKNFVRILDYGQP